MYKGQVFFHDREERDLKGQDAISGNSQKRKPRTPYHKKEEIENRSLNVVLCGQTHETERKNILQALDLC